MWWWKEDATGENTVQYRFKTQGKMASGILQVDSFQAKHLGFSVTGVSR